MEINTWYYKKINVEHLKINTEHHENLYSTPWKVILNTMKINTQHNGKLTQHHEN